MAHMDAPENFVERFAAMETKIDHIYKGWNNGGSPAAQRLRARVDGLFLAASIVVLGFAGWLGWLTLQVA